MPVLIKGHPQSPFHISVGGVVINQKQIALIQKPHGRLTLPRETIQRQESLVDCLVRGSREELAVEVKAHHYLGSLMTHFYLPDNIKIEKTTLYFLAEVIGDFSDRQPEDDEVEDQVLWLPFQEAYRKLEEQQNPEFQIISRAFPDHF